MKGCYHRNDQKKKIKKNNLPLDLYTNLKKEMKGKVEMEKAALGGLGPVFDTQGEDQRCVFLVDTTGNAYTFFKYKAKLIDLVSELMAVSIGKKEKADAMEDIRKGLTYGIKHGEVVVLHIGENAMDFEAFLKD